MDAVEDLHHEAMRLADRADHLRRSGDRDGSLDQLRRALDHERRAAALTANELTLEPTRSVLHRSAASLALQCGEFREAERLIAVALSGTTPETIANELRDLLGDVYFEKPPKGRRRSLSAPSEPTRS